MRCLLIPILLLTTCGGSGGDQPSTENRLDVPVPSGPPVVQQIDEKAPAARLTEAGGDVLISIACLSKPARLVVTVPSFTPIGSEDRLSFGIGSEPVTLVADPTRQPQQGVTGEGAVPGNFRDLLKEQKQISAVYGSQNSGPHPAPPEALSEALARACAS
jgi:hypothetical protein